MPGFNKNGPTNQGQMTGRGRGNCTNNGASTRSNGFTDRQFRCQGLRRGRGQGQWQEQGQGLRRGYASSPSTNPDSVARENLQLRADQLESELNAIKEKLSKA
ncbi:MAG: DUF5320 domain-containing protein [Thiotrichaceae bacterium]|nr:DUF5320 domain-containing protein [Thiotrichaceae bacterium]